MNKVIFLEDFIKDQVYVSKNNQELSKLLKEEKLTKQNIICESDFLKEGSYFIVKSFSTKVHIVKPNDTISSICQKYNLKEEDLKSKNCIEKIFLGQQLLI